MVSSNTRRYDLATTSHTTDASLQGASGFPRSGRDCKLLHIQVQRPRPLRPYSQLHRTFCSGLQHFTEGGLVLVQIRLSVHSCSPWGICLHDWERQRRLCQLSVAGPVRQSKPPSLAINDDADRRIRRCIHWQGEAGRSCWRSSGRPSSTRPSPATSIFQTGQPYPDLQGRPVLSGWEDVPEHWE